MGRFSEITDSLFGSGEEDSSESQIQEPRVCDVCGRDSEQVDFLTGPQQDSQVCTKCTGQDSGKSSTGVSSNRETRETKRRKEEKDILQSELPLDTDSNSHLLTQIRKMDPYEFEELVAKIWEKKGWKTEVTSGSTDRGIDVIATRDDSLEKRRHLIQVKRHGKHTKVGSEDIQRYAGLYARDEKVDAVFVVTSNQFTKEAEKVADNRNVRTIDCDELYKTLTET